MPSKINTYNTLFVNKFEYLLLSWISQLAFSQQCRPRLSRPRPSARLTTFCTHRKGPYPHFGVLLRAAFAEIGHGCLIRWLCIHIKVFLKRCTYVYWFTEHLVSQRPTRCRKCIVYSKVPNQ